MKNDIPREWVMNRTNYLNNEMIIRWFNVNEMFRKMYILLKVCYYQS
ncbi:MAG: hypothetical protein HUJ74_01595 [Lachnospiraceae bacterium]|nr:hypothetical protein [Lachnospiraceae bacterium]